jgi:hypothetical protein
MLSQGRNRMPVDGYGQGGGKSAADMKSEQQAAIDNAPTITRCVCGWTYEGTALEGRELAKGRRSSTVGRFEVLTGEDPS